jgi:SulP family sulfate permease
MLIDSLAPVDSLHYARSVREDTAELASYALSDKTSARSDSPPTRQRSAQAQLESYFTQGADVEASLNRDVEGMRHDIIQEVSEPASPESGLSDKSPGTSVLANMLRRSPPSTSPANGDEERDGKHLQGPDVDEVGSDQSRLIITSNGLRMDASERTPLLRKDVSFKAHHPDWIRGQRDIEGQEVRRSVSWPKLRNIVLWPREKAVDISRTVLNPKSWERKAIWEHAVVAPVSYLPAAILGLLLNILDALSYGKSIYNPSPPYASLFEYVDNSRLLNPPSACLRQRFSCR